jgi:hypothetical protein
MSFRHTQDPVPKRLLDHPELPGYVSDGAVLVDDESRSIPAELLRIPTSPAGRRRLFIGHCWHGYLLFEVSGQRGDGHSDFLGIFGERAVGDGCQAL